tara:strand:- start:162 stop:527 length:366 start_codon:yes stop_codon:yes gene_type:complete
MNEQAKLELVKTLLRDIYSIEKKSIRYFRRTNLNFIILLLVLEQYYENNFEENNIEKILQKIPVEYGSRPTIFKVIEYSLANNFFLKKNNPTDKRKYNLLPTKELCDDFEEWISKELLKNS